MLYELINQTLAEFNMGNLLIMDKKVFYH